MSLTMDIHEEGSWITIRLKGSLRGIECVSFGERMDDTIETGLCAAIDLSQVDAIDSRGLSELIQVVTRARLREARVALLNPNAFVKGLLSVTRLDEWFEIYPDMESARQAMSRP